ncbi:MAG: hypothetical protein JWS12_867 [Candidatus Saccharibacteria bacterium]|nr:hypothetical protein [Candidatus Saccharibacteria bacterium]
MSIEKESQFFQAERLDEEFRQWQQRDAEDAYPHSEGMLHGPYPDPDPTIKVSNIRYRLMEEAEGDPVLYQLFMLRYSLVKDINERNDPRAARVYHENWMPIREAILKRKQEVAASKK